jgi:hypothetical protein
VRVFKESIQVNDFSANRNRLYRHVVVPVKEFLDSFIPSFQKPDGEADAVKRETRRDAAVCASAISIIS